MKIDLKGVEIQGGLEEILALLVVLVIALAILL